MKFKRLLLLERFVSECLLIYPLYSIMFAARGHLSISSINVLFALWTATALLAEVPTGVIADRFPRKYVLLCSHVLRAIAFGVWLVAPHFAGFAAGLMIWSIGYALYSGTYQALVYDELVAINQQKKYIAFTSQAMSAGYAGMIVANTIAFFVTAHNVNYQVILEASIATSILAAGLVLLFPRATIIRQERAQTLRAVAGQAFRRIELRRTIMWLSLLGAAIGWFEEYISLFNRSIGVPTHWIPMAITLSLIIGILTNWLAPHIARLGNTLHFALFAGGCGCLILASYVHSLPLALLGGIFFLQILLLLRFVFDAELQDATPSHVRASMTSVVTFLARVIGIGVALSFAWFANQVGNLPGLRYSGCLLLGLGVLLLIIKPARRRVSRYYCVPEKLFR